MGIPIRIHFTLWAAFALIAWSLASLDMPVEYPGLAVSTYWEIGLASAFVLFASVLVHELSHSFVALRSGLPISRITLFFFGGVSEIGEEPRSAGLEVRMAAAGPLMSFAIAAALGALWILAGPSRIPVAASATLEYGAEINALLGAFNLVPAFPMDGGRVLRGSLWKRSGSRLRATDTAARVSKWISRLMIGVGFALLFLGDAISGVWIAAIGWFIGSSAGAGLRQAEIEETLSGVEVGGLMTRDPPAVPAEASVRAAAVDYFLAHGQSAFPVQRYGRAVGLITLRQVKAVPAEERETRTVESVMTPIDRVATAGPRTPAADAAKLLGQTKYPSDMIVVEEDGRLLGVLPLGDLIKAVRTRRELDTGETRSPA